MVGNSLQSTDKLPTQMGTQSHTRLFFIDHLRTALTILVLLHHVALVYQGGIPFYYVDPPKSESLGQLILFLFVLFNQAWFMGAFFLIAGYFTPSSFDRKGPKAFLKERLFRLGIPLIIFIFIFNPISSIGLYLEPTPLITDPLTWQNYWRIYPNLIGLGPLWFVALLLIFCFGYSTWRMLIKRQIFPLISEDTPPRYLHIGIFSLLLALVTYLFRIIIPMGKTVFDFPTLSYLPQYLSFFVVGITAYRYNWFRTIPNSMGIVGFITALVAVSLLFPLAFMSLLINGEILFLGNGTWQSAIYALWDSIFATTLCLATITFFRHFLNVESRFGRFLAQQSYTVYIIHSPIIVFITFALFLGYGEQGIDFGPLLKFAIAALIIVPTCFAIAYIMRKIPGISKIL